MSVGKPQPHFFNKKKVIFQSNVFDRHMDASVVSSSALAWQTTCYENPRNAQFSNAFFRCLHFFSHNTLNMTSKPRIFKERKEKKCM